MSSPHVQQFPHGIVQSRMRAGSLRAVLWQRIRRLGRDAWDALEEIGRRRSEHELLALSVRWKHSHPTLARELRSCARGGSSY